MSAQINANILKNFIVKTLGGDKITNKQAQKYDIDGDKFNEANVDENNYLELDEILNDKDLYAQFATMYVEEKENEANEKRDAEKEKDEQRKVKDKNGAGV